MNNSQLTKVMAELTNDLYYEKLGSMISKLRAWQKQKEGKIRDFYVSRSGALLEEGIGRQDRVLGYLEVFGCLLQDLGEFGGKMGCETTGGKRNGGILGKIRVGVETQYTQFLSNIENVRSVWISRKQNMRKIQNFAQVIVAGLRAQTDENNKLLAQLKSQCKKISTKSEELVNSYGNKFQINGVKKNQKQFQINKIKEVGDIFEQEAVELQQTYRKFMQIHSRFIEGQYYLAENFYSNISILNDILNQCFGSFGSTISNEAAKLLSLLKQQNKQMYLKIQVYDRTRTSIITQLKLQLQEINSQALQDIEIASWPLQCKSTDELLFLPKRGIITIDNKLLLVEDHSGSKRVESEINLAEVLAVEGDGTYEIVLKMKKKKSQGARVVIKFQKPQNQDQFKLHVLRIKGIIQ